LIVAFQEIPVTGGPMPLPLLHGNCCGQGRQSINPASMWCCFLLLALLLAALLLSLNVAVDVTTVIAISHSIG